MTDSTAPQAAVTVYSSDYCPYCIMAKRLLGRLGVQFNEIVVDNAPEQRREMQQLGGGHTVPQIFIAGQPIGGSDDLHALESRGKLNALLYPPAD